MQFIVVTKLKPGVLENGLPDNFHQLIKEETAQTLQGYLGGTLRQVWLRATGQGAIALIEADSQESAEALINAFPLFKAGMVEAEIIGLAPYTGFGAPQI